ncbi:MAG: DegT/DnrJ/EryC1/StrS family aminotransferase [Bryobacteraceae bacterium]|nr:DegT/DnrJ/EryC1/StrS family aminotransferase [Bryobacteraceae bacterium]
MNLPALLGGEPVRRRPFPAWPVFDAREEQLALEVLRSGQWWRYTLGETLSETHADPAAAPSKVAELQHKFAAAHGCRYGIACVNGTAALEVALRAMDIGPGDEVIVPPYTFIATATAPMLIGATPVFCDIQLDTFNLDPARLEAAITPRTRAIIPVHFAGLAADLDPILAIAARHHLPVLEDAAHAHGGAWNGQPLGSLGAAATFSFQASKNMTAGEGGIITTNDPALAEICESLVWVGRKTGRPWYEHHRLGWNYRITEFQAAILLAQLERLPAQTALRQQNGARLAGLLREIPGIAPLAAPVYASGHAWHIFVFRFLAAEFGLSRTRFLEALAAEGIPASSGYAHPLYRNPLFAAPGLPLDYSKFIDLCPASEQACAEAVWLEHRLLLAAPEEIDDIAAAIAKIHHHRAALTKD